MASSAQHAKPAAGFDPEWVRDHLKAIADRRGVPNWFDRFEPGRLTRGAVELQLDSIAVGKSRPTIVFMPGTNAYALLYGEALVALAERGFNVVGFDPRGHGRSGGARGSYTIPELVDDLAAVVDYARARFDAPVVAMGSSQGGITAFYLAATKADLHGVVCHNVADLADPESVRLTRFPTLGRWLQPLLLRAARVLPELPVPMSAYLDLAREPVAHMGTAYDVLRQDPLLVRYVRLKTLASLGSTPLSCAVGAIRTPVQVLHAERDTIFPLDYVRHIYDRLTCDKELHVYPGLPHYMIVDHVAAYLDDVCRFVGRVTTGSGR